MTETKLEIDLGGIENLPKNLQKNSYKKAMRAAAKLAVQDMRNAAPEVSGALKKSISSKVDSPKGETSAYAVIGPRSSFTKTVNGHTKKPSRYSWFIEEGRFARPFIRPTFGRGQTRYVAEIEKVMAQEINKFIGDK